MSLTDGSAKMSKSVGNIIDPEVLVARYGQAAVRYYLLSDISTGRDADFSIERLEQRYNAELANSLGNLLNRTLSMAKRYRSGILRRMESPLAAFVQEKTSAYDAAMSSYQVQAAIEAAMEIESLRAELRLGKHKYLAFVRAECDKCNTIITLIRETLDRLTPNADARLVLWDLIFGVLAAAPPIEF